MKMKKKWKKTPSKNIKNIKIRNDRKEIKQKINHQQNNQTSCMYQISPWLLINPNLFKMRMARVCESWLGQKQIEIVGKK